MNKLGLPLQLFLGGRLAKADKRGKIHSVDRTIRASHNVALEARMADLFSEWRTKAAKRAAAVYGRVKKAEVDDLLDSIIDAIDIDGFSVDMIEELTPGIRRAFKEAGVSALTEAGFSTADMVNQLDERALDYVRAHGADLVTQITETTRMDLREILADAVEEGPTTAALASTIEDAFAFSKYRSEMIARTELAYAHVGGNLAGYRESGVVSGKKWIVAQDNVCPECEALDGVVVDLDEEFPDDGGEGPPLHPNCRCDVVPVLEEEAPTRDEEGPMATEEEAA